MLRTKKSCPYRVERELRVELEYLCQIKHEYSYTPPFPEHNMIAEYEDALSSIVAIMLMPAAFLAMMCFPLLVLAIFYIVGTIAYLVTACPSTSHLRNLHHALRRPLSLINILSPGSVLFYPIFRFVRKVPESEHT